MRPLCLLNISAPDFAREIARVLEESALVHAKWAAVHLRSELKKWFWKDDHHNLKHRFLGQVDVEAIQAKARMVDIIDEVLLHFSSRPGMKIRLTVNLEVDCPGGFDEALERTVRDNCNSLGFRNSEFEE